MLVYQGTRYLVYSSTAVGFIVVPVRTPRWSGRQTLVLLDVDTGRSPMADISNDFSQDILLHDAQHLHLRSASLAQPKTKASAAAAAVLAALNPVSYTHLTLPTILLV